MLHLIHTEQNKNFAILSLKVLEVMSPEMRKRFTTFESASETIIIPIKKDSKSKETNENLKGSGAENVKSETQKVIVVDNLNKTKIIKEPETTTKLTKVQQIKNDEKTNIKFEANKDQRINGRTVKKRQPEEASMKNSQKRSKTEEIVKPAKDQKNKMTMAKNVENSKPKKNQETKVTTNQIKGPQKGKEAKEIHKQSVVLKPHISESMNSKDVLNLKSKVKETNEDRKISQEVIPNTIIHDNFETEFKTETTDTEVITEIDNDDISNPTDDISNQTDDVSNPTDDISNPTDDISNQTDDVVVDILNCPLCLTKCPDKKGLLDHAFSRHFVNELKEKYLQHTKPGEVNVLSNL
jgi:hypothetical protein